MKVQDCEGGSKIRSIARKDFKAEASVDNQRDMVLLRTAFSSEDDELKKGCNPHE